MFIIFSWCILIELYRIVHADPSSIDWVHLGSQDVLRMLTSNGKNPEFELERNEKYLILQSLESARST